MFWLGLEEVSTPVLSVALSVCMNLLPDVPEHEAVMDVFLPLKG